MVGKKRYVCRTCVFIIQQYYSIVRTRCTLCTIPPAVFKRVVLLVKRPKTVCRNLKTF